MKRMKERFGIIVRRGRFQAVGLRRSVMGRTETESLTGWTTLKFAQAAVRRARFESSMVKTSA